MEKLYVKNESEKEIDENDNYAQNETEDEDTDSDFDDMEMEDFIAEESEEKNLSDDENDEENKGGRSEFTDEFTKEDLDLLAQMEGKKVLADNYVEANKNRKFRKLKKIASENSDDEQINEKDKTVKQKRAINNEDDFIVDDIGPTEDRDDYTLEIKGPAHTSEAMTTVTSIFGDVTDFLQSVSFRQKTSEKKQKTKIASQATNKATEFSEEGETFVKLVHNNDVQSKSDSENNLSRIKKTTHKTDLALIEAEKKHIYNAIARNTPSRLVPSQNFPFTIASLAKPESLELFLAREADFIYRKHFFKSGPSVREHILEVLKLLRHEKYEIPFINLYLRGKWCTSSFNEEDLWHIFTLDRTYLRWAEKYAKIEKIVRDKMVADVRGREILCGFLADFATEESDLDNVTAYVSFVSGCLLDSDSERFLEALNAVRFNEFEFDFKSLRDRLKESGKEEEKEEKSITVKEKKGESIPLEKTDVEYNRESKILKKPKKKLFNFSVKMMAFIKSIGVSLNLHAGLVAALDENIDKIGEEDEESLSGLVPPDGFENEINVWLEEIIHECLEENTMFKNVENVIQSAVDFLANEIGLNPLVKKIARKLFLENATLSTRPTKKGWKEIDWTHPFFTVKRLVKKPLKAYLEEFSSKGEDMMLEQYSLLNDAVKKGFIEKRFELDSPLEESTIAKTLKTAYKFSSSDPLNRLNEIKQRVIIKVLEKWLLPDCEEYSNNLLLAKANQYIASMCAKNLKKRLAIKGIPVNGANVFAICIGDINQPSFCAVVNSRGLLVDFAKFSFLKVSVHRNVLAERNVELLKKNEDLEKFKNLVLEHSPTLIMVGASCFGCDRLLMDIEKVCCVSTVNIRCELINPEIAKIFERSKRSESEFFEYPTGLQNAISLARLALDPLNEICYMALGDEESNDILSLYLHEHQRLVPRKLLLKEIEDVLVQCVNRVGVSVNDGVLCYPHKRCSLNFVCGLGQKMANYIIERAKRSITSRKQLKQILDKFPKIYENCVGFIKIEPTTEMLKIKFLERTRITPPLYLMTKRVLLFAQGKDVYDENEKLQNVQKLAKKANKKFGAMIGFDYAKCVQKLSNETDFGENLLYLIKFIVREIKAPFQMNKMKEFEKMNDEELFWLITCESKRTFLQGQIVTATVIGFGKEGAICQMNCNVLGRISSENLEEDDEQHFDDNKVNLMKKKLKIGMTLKARISEISMVRGNFMVILDSRKETLENYDLEDPSLIYYPKKLDKYLDLTADKEDPDENLQSKAQNGPSFISRKIDFPFFKNFSRSEAEKHLEDKDVGSLVVRPSSRGMNYLTATWKISRDPFICVNIEIKEKNKANSFSIGRLLEINKLQFEDLDEIYARFFERMTARMKEMMSHRRFRFGTEEEVERLMLFDKKENATGIPYAIGFSLKHPGYLAIFYVFSSSVKHEYIVVLPQGFKFRGKMFKTPESLIHWFKRHPYENSPFQKRRQATTPRTNQRDNPRFGESHGDGKRFSGSKHKDNYSLNDYGGGYGEDEYNRRESNKDEYSKREFNGGKYNRTMDSYERDDFQSRKNYSSNMTKEVKEEDNYDGFDERSGFGGYDHNDNEGDNGYDCSKGFDGTDNYDRLEDFDNSKSYGDQENFESIGNTPKSFRDGRGISQSRGGFRGKMGRFNGGERWFSGDKRY